MDGLAIECRWCGAEISLDRWDGPSLHGFCSRECEAHHWQEKAEQRKARKAARELAGSPAIAKEVGTK